MHKHFLLLIFIVSFCQISYSQNQHVEDILHLKNGKVISGTILKQEFGVITIKVAGNNDKEEKIVQVQQFEISKVVKGSRPSSLQSDTLKEGDANIQNAQKQPFPDKDILKEQTGNLLPTQIQQQMVLQPLPKPDKPIPLPEMRGSVSLSPGQSAGGEVDLDPYRAHRPRRQPKLWYRDIRGFRGFIDYAYIHGLDATKNHRLEYAMSLGFQFNPIFYTGIGAGYTVTLKKGRDAALPVFINQRINFLDEYTTPFWDLKLGYSVAEGKGFYLSSGFGVSFTKKGKRAFNLSLIYSLQDAKYYEWSEQEPPSRIERKQLYHGLALKLSYEFGIGR
ncbi:MAG: hypothetical protein ACK5M3_18890 [Dysgonomonas sp.]